MSETEDRTNIQQNFATPDETRLFDKGRVDVVQIGDLEVMRATFEPGWTWKTCIKPVSGGDSCHVEHKWYVVSGRMAMKMDDGTDLEWSAGDVGVVPAGHDAWVVGDQPFVFIDFEGAHVFAKPQN